MDFASMSDEQIEALARQKAQEARQRYKNDYFPGFDDIFEIFGERKQIEESFEEKPLMSLITVGKRTVVANINAMDAFLGKVNEVLIRIDNFQSSNEVQGGGSHSYYKKQLDEIQNVLFHIPKDVDNMRTKLVEHPEVMLQILNRLESAFLDLYEEMEYRGNTRYMYRDRRDSLDFINHLKMMTERSRDEKKDEK